MTDYFIMSILPIAILLVMVIQVRLSVKERKIERKHLEMSGKYRVIQMKNGKYTVQQYVYDWPDKEYYRSTIQIKKWHWKYLGPEYSSLEQARNYKRRLEYEVEASKREERRRQTQEDARYEGRRVEEVIDD